MTLWARLTWQVADPAGFAREIGARLGVDAREGGGAPGAFVMALGTARLEVRPWVREGPDDHPRSGGRLMLEPVPGGEEPPADRDAGPLVLAGVGWATVELDRAETELGPWLGGADEPAGDAGTRSGSAPALHDPHLGAVARVRLGDGLPGERFVLLEPATEGRLAASLALDGEGPCALYLRPATGLEAWAADASDRGVTLGPRRPGPLGEARLLLGGPAGGPHLLFVDAQRPSNRKRAAGTIAP
jgi:hypothetical protein